MTTAGAAVAGVKCCHDLGRMSRCCDIARMAWSSLRCGDRLQSLHVQPASLGDVTEPIGLAAALTGDVVKSGG